MIRSMSKYGLRKKFSYLQTFSFYNFHAFSFYNLFIIHYLNKSSPDSAVRLALATL